MGRTSKPGISYYSMDVDHTENYKIKLLVNEFDSHGYWVYQCLLGRIYKNRGYFMDLNNEDELILFTSDICKKPVSLVNDIIKCCVRRDLFDKKIYEKFGVLTNDRIQNNYIEATRDRRKKNTVIDLIKEFLVVKIPDAERNFQLININQIIPGEELNSSYEQLELSPCDNPQSKVNKSKEEESKENYVRDNDFESSVLNFFGFNEIANYEKMVLLSQCCNALQNSGQYENFKNQFVAYSEYKSMSGFKHSFYNFLGKQENLFIDGAWNAENWQKKLKEQLSQKNGTNNQRSHQSNCRGAATGRTPLNGYSKP